MGSAERRETIELIIILFYCIFFSKFFADVMCVKFFASCIFFFLYSYFSDSQ